MSIRMVVYGLVAVFALSTLYGCGTVPKKFKEEVGGIKARVETLESKVEGIEARQAEPAPTVAFSDDESYKMAGSNISTKPRARGSDRVSEIQECLKNAGFYNGAIDGIKGKQTRRAIKEFQKANGLTADGVVGKKTWEVLRTYAGGTAAASGAGSEGAVK